MSAIKKSSAFSIYPEGPCTGQSSLPISVCGWICQKEGDGGALLLLDFARQQGLSVGGDSHGAPQNWVRRINFLACPMEANGRLAWEVSLPNQPFHPQPSARTGREGACRFSLSRVSVNVCVE